MFKTIAMRWRSFQDARAKRKAFERAVRKASARSSCVDLEAFDKGEGWRSMKDRLDTQMAWDEWKQTRGMRRVFWASRRVEKLCYVDEDPRTFDLEALDAALDRVWDDFSDQAERAAVLRKGLLVALRRGTQPKAVSAVELLVRAGGQINDPACMKAPFWDDQNQMPDLLAERREELVATVQAMISAGADFDQRWPMFGGDSARKVFQDIANVPGWMRWPVKPIEILEEAERGLVGSELAAPEAAQGVV